METWYRDQKNAQSSSAASAASISGGRYRDRAKERRQKYGIDDEGPRPNRLKEKYLAAVEEAEMAGNSKGSNREKMPIDGSNIGSKMLQKMGWKEGLGLGKANQGRTTIIEVKIQHGWIVG